jgi:cellulose synthase/poly-beta-1,6-N-acetylglucosamine synthase-like glycosyltransferase
MIVLFWVGVVWIAYVYVGYPLILWLLGLVRTVGPEIRADHRPSVSVLIAAWNEERDIAWKLTETLNWDYPADRFEVLVASDGSEDRTDEIVRGMTDARLTFVRMEQRGGKSAALNRLAQLARGEILFFTDANSHIEPGALRRIARHFADSRVGCVTGEMHYRDEREESAVSEGTRVYWGYEALIKQMESRIGSVLVCVGSVFAIRTALFEPLHPEVANDLELPLRIGRTGRWLRYEPTVRSVERPAQTGREEFSRQRRIVAQGALALWRLRAQLTPLRAWQFISRKVLRWLTAVPLVLLLVSTAALAPRSPFGLLLVPQVAFWALALVGYILARAGVRPGRLFSLPFYVVLVAFAGVMGVIDACAGRRFRVWDTAALSRGSAN